MQLNIEKNAWRMLGNTCKQNGKENGQRSGGHCYVYSDILIL